MMAVMAFLVFGVALAASLWSIYATVAPRFGRIVDLLTYGPVAMPMLPAPVPARSSLRNVRVRQVGSSPRRAAA